MPSIELTKEEVQGIVQMIEGSTIQMAFAEKAIVLLNKFKAVKQ